MWNSSNRCCLHPSSRGSLHALRRNGRCSTIPRNSRQHHRHHRRKNNQKKNIVAESAALEVNQAKLALERQGYLFVDMRSEKAYENEHIVKPPKSTVNIPITDDVDSFCATIREKWKNPQIKLLLVGEDGDLGIRCAEKLKEENGYDMVFGVIGGYVGWMKVWTPSGRKRPPAGRFVSTGKEAPKSGLTLSDEVAATYEENWGNPEASLPLNRIYKKKDN